VALLATPHAGSRLASAVSRLRAIFRPSPATASLVHNDPHLRDLKQWYCNWATSRKIGHLALVEKKPVRFLGIIVDPESADPGIVGEQIVPVDYNHITIAKPEDRDSEIYRLVLKFLECTLRQSHKVVEIDKKHGVRKAA